MDNNAQNFLSTQNSNSNSIKESSQMDLFSMVDLPHSINGIYQQYSNLIGHIELIPRYVRGKCPPIPLSQAADNTIVENNYRVGASELTCSIQPAIIRRKNSEGKVVDHIAYPGDREELIERILFMFASQNGSERRTFNSSVPRYGVKFSLYDIREALKALGKTKSYDVIRESLIIIRDSRVTISQSQDGKMCTITNNIFADAVLETSGSGRARDRCFISFSDYVVEQIKQLNYSQYNITSALMKSFTLSRFLHTYLSVNWRNAYEGATFELHVDSVMASFGKTSVTDQVKRREMRPAMEELVKCSVIKNVPYLKNNSYTVTATEKLAEEIKRSNQKRAGIKTLNDKIESGEITSLPNRRSFLDTQKTG